MLPISIIYNIQTALEVMINIYELHTNNQTVWLDKTESNFILKYGCLDEGGIIHDRAVCVR